MFLSTLNGTVGQTKPIVNFLKLITMWISLTNNVFLTEQWRCWSSLWHPESLIPAFALSKNECMPLTCWFLKGRSCLHWPGSQLAVFTPTTAQDPTSNCAHLQPPPPPHKKKETPPMPKYWAKRPSSSQRPHTCETLCFMSIKQNEVQEISGYKNK